MLVNHICDHLSERIINNELSNTELVQIIEHVGGYLNLKTIPQYAKENKMSYNGAKKFRNVIELFEIKFVVDNE